MAPANSLDSSPRSRDSWDPRDPQPDSKLRLMISYGGRIVPRPTDHSLCYLGGETRILSLHRRSSLSDLLHKLSCTLPISSSSFSLKYQLPDHDLDSLISLTTDDDLDNLIEEHDRLLHTTTSAPSKSNSDNNNNNNSNNNKSSNRIRLFVFTTTTNTNNSTDSESWFVDALNSAASASASADRDAESLNCLLDLEEDFRNLSVGSASSAKNSPSPVVDDAPKHQRQAPMVEATTVSVSVSESSRPVYYQERMREAQIDPVPMYQMQQVPMVAHAQVTQPNPQFVQQVPSPYYQVPQPVPQSYDPSMNMYYVPVHQNLPPVSAVHTPKPEMQQPSNMYQTVAPPAPVMHMASPPAATHGHGAYTRMGYQVMHPHPHSSPAPAPAPAPVPQAMGNYVHQGQVYYTQATPVPVPRHNRAS